MPGYFIPTFDRGCTDLRTPDKILTRGTAVLKLLQHLYWCIPSLKKAYSSFKPKNKILQNVLKQKKEKKKKWNSDSRKEISKTERFFNKPCKRSLSTWNKNTIYYLYHMPYIAKIGSKYSHVILLAYWHS